MIRDNTLRFPLLSPVRYVANRCETLRRVLVDRSYDASFSMEKKCGRYRRKHSALDSLTSGSSGIVSTRTFTAVLNFFVSNFHCFNRKYREEPSSISVLDCTFFFHVSNLRISHYRSLIQFYFCVLSGAFFANLY